MLAQVNSLRLGTLVLVAALLLGTASAAAAPNEASFDPVGGQVLPVVGGKTAVDLVCGASARSDCNGRVLLVPRGRAIEALGKGPIAESEPLDAARGEDLAPRMEIGDAALEWVRENGPLPVMAVLRIPGVDPTRPFFLDGVELVKAPPPTRRARSSATASAVHTESFRWDFKLKAGTAVALREFRCPSSAQYVAEGNIGSRAGVAGDVRVFHSDGVGYGSFDDVIVKPYWREGDTRKWTLSGWTKGGWFSNNIFAPMFEAGTFAMIVTCTDTFNKAAWMEQVFGRFEDPYPTYLLLPWKATSW